MTSLLHTNRFLSICDSHVCFGKKNLQLSNIFYLYSHYDKQSTKYGWKLELFLKYYSLLSIPLQIGYNDIKLD